MITTSRFSKAGFSLVEVAMALGIAAFCLTSVFGLLPVGLTSNQNSMEQTSAASLVTAVCADLRAAPAPSASGTSKSPTFQISIPPPSASPAQSVSQLYFAEDGSPLGGPAGDSRYLVSVGMTPPSTNSRSATLVRILVTWPAAANATAQPDQWPAKFTGSFEACTAINRN